MATAPTRPCPVLRRIPADSGGSPARHRPATVQQPRCLPDASRCFPDAPQMPPRCLQIPPDASRCFQMPPRCFPNASRCLVSLYAWIEQRMSTEVYFSPKSIIEIMITPEGALEVEATYRKIWKSKSLTERLYYFS